MSLNYSEIEANFKFLMKLSFSSTLLWGEFGVRLALLSRFLNQNKNVFLFQSLSSLKSEYSFSTVWNKSAHRNVGWMWTEGTPNTGVVNGSPQNICFIYFSTSCLCAQMCMHMFKNKKMRNAFYYYDDLLHSCSPPFILFHKCLLKMIKCVLWKPSWIFSVQLFRKLVVSKAGLWTGSQNTGWEKWWLLKEIPLQCNETCRFLLQDSLEKLAEIEGYS